MLDREPDRGPVRRDTLLDDVCMTRPDAERVLFEEFKLPCYDCEVRFYESVEQACSYYGIDPDVMVRRLNELPLGPEEPPDGGAPEQARARLDHTDGDATTS